MKGLKIKLIMLLAGILLSAGAYAQNWGPEWGKDPADRMGNVMEYNFFRDAYIAKDYANAVNYLQKLLQRAPAGHENIYIYGVNIYSNKIDAAASPADKKMYIDSLVMLYDMRAQYFGDKTGPNAGKAYILRWKADKYAGYAADDTKGALKFYQDAMAASGENVPIDFLNRYFQHLTDAYKNDEVETDAYLAEYDKLGPIVAKSDDEAQRKTFEALFLSSGAANCETVQKIWEKRIADDPQNPEVYDRALAQLNRGKCEGPEFYIKVAEGLHALAPSANTANALAKYFASTQNYTKALKYLRDALDIETNPSQKAMLTLAIAGIELSQRNPRVAADYARQAMTLDPSSGLAYEILASAYASSAGSCSDDFSRAAIYWLVYDTFAKARNLYSDAGDQEKVRSMDQMMATYRRNFPRKEEGFFRNITEGSTYRYSDCGWMSGNSAVARFRQD